MVNSNRITVGLFMGVLFAALIFAFRKSDAPSEYTQANASYVLNQQDLDRLKVQATAGDSAAAIRVAKHYGFIALDNQAAIRWWEVAAKLGDVNAQYTIGLLLVDSKDLAESERGLEWLRLAARNGDKSAARLLETRDSKQTAPAPTKRSASEPGR
jgi:TPR repeat protein